MRSREKYNAWRREWWAKTKQLAGNLTESRIFLDADVYKWVSDIAVETEERLPIVMGKLLGRLKAIEDGEEPDMQHAQPDNSALSSAFSRLTSAVDNELLGAILGSRFPGDTGAARLRQVGLVIAVASELESRGKPTASSIGRYTDNHPTQISNLARTLQDRGVIDIRHTPSPIKGRTAKIYSIRHDALAALHEAHREATGEAIKPWPLD